MEFLNILFCCVEILFIICPPVYGQFPPNLFNPAQNPLGNLPGIPNNFNPGGGNKPFFPNPFDSLTNPANNGPGNINNFNPLANNPLANNPLLNNPLANNPLLNNPLANNPLANLPSSVPSGIPKNDDGILPFLKDLMDQLTNPTSQPPSFPPGLPNNDGNKPVLPNPYSQPTQPVNNFPPGGLPIDRNQPSPNNFNKPPTTPFFQSPVNQPGGFNPFNPNQQTPINNSPPNRPFNPPPSNQNNFNPYSQPTQPVNNFPPGGLPIDRNQPPPNNFNKPPTTPFFQSPVNQPGGFNPFNPNQQTPFNNYPPNGPLNPPPANQNNFKPQPSFPQFPNNQAPQLAQQPHLSEPPPPPPFHPALNKGPSNHSIHPHFFPFHHVGPSVHHHAKPPSTPPPPPADGDPLEGHRIVCIFNNKHYYRNEFSPDKINGSLCTHLNYEFAMLDPKSYEMISSEPELDIQMGFFEEAVKLKKSNDKLKVLISLGGWADSTEKYSILANDKELRSNFVETAVKFIKKHDFDGMDLAWEYPNCWQGALGISPKDKGNFVLLLQDLRKAFNPEKLLLSISVGAVKREIKAAYDIPEVSKNVDFINVMTYDMHGPWESTTGHHTQFDKMPGDKDPYWNSKGALTVWVEGGAPKMKLNMGIACYGKTFTLKDPKKNGLNAEIIGVGNSNIDSVEGGFILYNTMCQWLGDGNWTEKEDRRAGFYAFSGDQWSCYDPPMMVVRKAKFIVEEEYSGLIFKDLGGDDYLGICFPNMTFPLLMMARFEMLHRIHAKHHHALKHFLG